MGNGRDAASAPKAMGGFGVLSRGEASLADILEGSHSCCVGLDSRDKGRSRETGEEPVPLIQGGQDEAGSSVMGGARVTPGQSPGMF